jgi:hypothetical protein
MAGIKNLTVFLKINLFPKKIKFSNIKKYIFKYFHFYTEYISKRILILKIRFENKKIIKSSITKVWIATSSTILLIIFSHHLSY